MKRNSLSEALGPVTPTSNRSLAQNLAGFGSLTEGLDYAAQGVTGFNFFSSRGALETSLPYAEMRRRALTAARKLLSLGLNRGDRVAVVAETGPEFVTLFFGCQYAGLIPCPLPYTMYMGGKDAYVERIAGMLTAAGAETVVTGRDLLGHVAEGAARAGAKRVLTHDEIEALPQAATKLEPFRPDEAAYIQYSSGSTSCPKGVLISQSAIMANARGILREGLKLAPDDRAFSWLPLYHDMGLVGFCLSPMLGQVSVDFIATGTFARRPALWLSLMSNIGSTVTYAPSFGYDLAARRINGEAVTLDLSRLRVAGIGGDMVRADVLDRFTDTLSVAGFRPEAFLPSYGMAETTLAISFASFARPVRIDAIDRHALKTEARAVPAKGGNARRFVVCGRPLAESAVEIRNEHGQALGERLVGRIFVKTPSLMSGYFRDDQATSAAVGLDGFLDTGDMGYWLDGEIVITGRAKDLILHNGRNIWPQDIEWAAEHLEALRAGDVAAFAIEGENGDDEVVVLVQCRLQDLEAIEGLRRDVAAVVHRGAGVECKVVMVPPKSLPFTSSGKLSRASAKQKFLSGEIAEITAMPFAAEAAGFAAAL
ncbi:MAG: fatty acyl-AMP ligase [Aestuariivirga sp.]|uniref:fatty acyl-AMP ligase n=1 Tax=Aestuariivirga sp. TaxID=2650926 RepID=UPI0038CFB4AC